MAALFLHALGSLGQADSALVIILYIFLIIMLLAFESMLPVAFHKLGF